MIRVKWKWMIIVLLLFSFFISFPVLGEETRVFDHGGLFTEEEIEELQSQIISMKKEMNMDVLIVTTADTGGKLTQMYAEDYYMDGNYGVGSDYRGVLFLIDMDNREIYILPVGKMNRFLTDERWNHILDEAYEAVSEGDYAGGGKAFLDGVTTYYRAGIPGGQYNYDKETGEISVYRSVRWYEAVVAIVVAAIAGAVACLTVTNQYSMKKEKNRSGNYLKAYREASQFSYSNQTDHLINQVVTHVMIPENTMNHSKVGSSGRSTTHTSSGRTMGGGGRKF